MTRLSSHEVVMQDELRSDETVLHVAHRHVIVLLLRILVPCIIAAGSLGLGWYRISRPMRIQRFDVLELILVSIGVLALLLIIYLYIDWKKDQIVLTNQRIIFNKEKPLIRRIQEQLPINDIHQVEAVTSSYPEHWLHYGSISIQSAAFARAMIFRGVSHPQKLQVRVMRLIESLKQEQVDEDDFESMVDRRVYHNEPPMTANPPEVKHTYTPRILSWLFNENPYYDDEENSYTWHPHWVFLIKELVKPGLLLLVLLVAFFVVARAEMVTEVWTISFLLVGTVIVIGWAAWEIEDHRNDLYILTPTQVIDIDKEPFGPENQSSAGLDSIQNITYKTTLISRILGYGDVWLELAGSGDRLTFFNVPRPRDVVSVIDSYQGHFNKSQKERNLEDTLKVLHSYHELQQKTDDTATTPDVSSNDNNGGTSEQQPMTERDEALLDQLLRKNTAS